MGSTQFSKPVPFDPDDRPARDRADENVKHAFPTHEGTTWDKVLNTILDDAEIQNQVIEDIISARFIDDATQYQLDLIAEYFGINRRADETDDHFRARIKSQLPRQTTDTTIDEIIRVSSQLIGTPRQRILVDENFQPHYTESDFTQAELDQLAIDYAEYDAAVDETQVDGWGDLTESEQESALVWRARQDDDDVAFEPARFDVVIEEIAFHDTPITTTDMEELLTDIKAAGVRVLVTVGEQFTHRSVDDYDGGVNDPDKAYDGVNPDVIQSNTDEPDTVNLQAIEDGADQYQDIGGPYADEITSQY